MTPAELHLTDGEKILLTAAHDAAQADVEHLLGRADIHQWLDEDGPIIATMRLHWLMDEELTGAAAVSLAAHLAIQLIQTRRGGR